MQTRPGIGSSSSTPFIAPSAPAADSEAALLAAMAMGDEAALIALYARAAGTIRACCLRILLDTAEADDATSETFWRLWTRADRYDPAHCSAMAWIMTVTRRLALDRRRAILRQGRLLDHVREEPTLARPSFADEGADDRLDVAAVLARLPYGDRRLLEQAYFEGLSGSDIASREAIPLGTVKSRMRAALSRLRHSFHRGVS